MREKADGKEIERGTKKEAKKKGDEKCRQVEIKKGEGAMFANLMRLCPCDCIMFL